MMMGGLPGGRLANALPAAPHARCSLIPFLPPWCCCCCRLLAAGCPPAAANRAAPPSIILSSHKSAITLALSPRAGMMAAGMRPGLAAAGGAGAGIGAGVKPEPRREPSPEQRERERERERSPGPRGARDGPRGGDRYGGRRDGGFDHPWERGRYERERFDGRGPGPRDRPPPFGRDGPPYGRGGPPPFGYGRDGPPPPHFRWVAGCWVAAAEAPQSCMCWRLATPRLAPGSHSLPLPPHAVQGRAATRLRPRLGPSGALGPPRPLRPPQPAAWALGARTRLARAAAEVC